MNDAILILETLWKPTDKLFIGDRHQAGIAGETIRIVPACPSLRPRS